jgi:hypothetical protein
MMEGQMLINSDHTASRPVATTGADNIYAELHLRRQGVMIELRVDAVLYDP